MAACNFGAQALLHSIAVLLYSSQLTAYLQPHVCLVFDFLTYQVSGGNVWQAKVVGNPRGIRPLPDARWTQENGT
eukprot:scaffold135501_cov15-Tisochrysis_lutea.AAC.2